MKCFEENCEIDVKMIPFKVLTTAYKNGFQTVPHWHKSQEILLVKSGMIHVSINNSAYEANEGDVVLINAFDVHAVVGDAIVQVLQFEINRNIYQIDAFKIFMLPNKMRVLTEETARKANIERELRELFSVYELQSDSFEINILGCIYKIIYFVSQITGTEKESMAGYRHRMNVEKLEAVLEYVELHYESSISVKDVSKLMCFSPNYFCRFFKSVMGITFFEYLNMYRCDKAEYMLKFSEESITDIAFSTGFSSVQYFNRVYKQYKKRNPSEDRRRSRQEKSRSFQEEHVLN